MLDAGRDQAFGLRQLFVRPSLRVLPVVGEHARAQSGAFVLNLAAALSRLGCRPIVIDGMRDGVAASLGNAQRLDLADLLEGRREFCAVAMRSREGLCVLPAARGLAGLTRDAAVAEATFSAIASLEEGFDIAILHAPGATLGALFSGQMAETVMLCGPGEDDLTATYGRLKSMANDHGLSRFRVVFDQVQAPAATERRHRRLASAANRFLSVAVEFGGEIVHGREFELARQARSSVFSVAAQGPAARAFESIASRARDWELASFDSGGPAIH